MSRTPRRRLDRVLVERGLATDLDDATRRIEEGVVVVSGAPATSPSRAVAADEPVRLVERDRYVGRGGEKLDAALSWFDVEVAGHAALDVGASTGGFTDCLLARGARRVLAVDVGRAQLHERLLADPRVVSLEQTNLRDLTDAQVTDALGGPATVVTADLSFASLVPHAARLVALGDEDATLVLLVKPQFEASHAVASKGAGVVSDPAEWHAAVVRCASALERAGAGIMGAMASPIRGAAGNVEFFVAARRGDPDHAEGDLRDLVAGAVARVAPR